MQIDGIRSPVPEDKHVRDTPVKFTKPFKWSPRGWDIEKCRPGETVSLPKHIAEIAVNEGAGALVTEEEAAAADEAKAKTAAPTRRNGR